MHNINVPVDKIKIQGSHTFSSLLAHVPDFLVGRTAEDINPIDIFCILLHLCNENVSACFFHGVFEYSSADFD